MICNYEIATKTIKENWSPQKVRRELATKIIGGEKPYETILDKPN